MIPAASVDIFVDLPSGDLWLPDFEELDDDGFGYFHDKWTIRNVNLEEASAIRRIEDDLLRQADEESQSAEEFDALCAQLEAIDDGVDPELGSLEIGVAGLSHILNLVGAGTAASCRGHSGPLAWTTRPVVYFAAESAWAREIASAAADSGCGLSLSEDQLLMVWASSVHDTVHLADLLLDRQPRFANLGRSAFQRWAALMPEQW